MGIEDLGTANQDDENASNRKKGPSWLECAIIVAVITALNLAIVLAALGPRAQRDRERAPSYRERESPSPSVSLTIDYGNGVTRDVQAVLWTEGTTVEGLMADAARISPGFEYETKGAGEMTMLTSLDGVANGEGNGRYWLYSVNGKPGEMSFAVQPLAAGDRVLWKFTEPE